jgi:glycosyltransferase involved in cell wall biosynthesis
MSPNSPLVTILVNNYNYGQYLSQAIDSALNQTWARCEVVIVDDGSTDDSASIIASYGRSVISILKANGGQGSTFNSGFQASRGEIVCFLDSDDVFLPDKVEHVVEASRRNPDAGLIYHQMSFIDWNGRSVGRRWPSSVVQGLLRSRVEHSGGWWPLPTTSGLCCSRAYLTQILPMPVEPFRLCADSYVGGLAPFITRVVGIRKPLTLYRLHGSNNHAASGATRLEVQRRIDRYELEFRELNLALLRFGGSGMAMSLEDHYPYQMCRWMAREPVSRARVLATAWKTQSLPAAMKCRELLKTSLKSRPRERHA